MSTEQHLAATMSLSQKNLEESFLDDGELVAKILYDEQRAGASRFDERPRSAKRRRADVEAHEGTITI